MNDTQQEFEKAVSDAGWASNYQGDGQYAGVTIPFAWKMWQACQRLNDDRITSLESQLADALAANQVMRDALKGAKEFFDSDGDISCRSEMMIATAVRNALAIKPGDVTLVEVGMFYRKGDSIFSEFKSSTEIGEIPHQTRLYAIQTKE